VSPPAALSQTPPAAAPAASPGTPTTIRSITQSSLPRGDRITSELGQEVAYSGERVGSPDRLYFDFPKATLASSVAKQIQGISSPLVHGVRVGTPTPGVSRVVLELAHAPRYSTFPMYGPFRLVIDVEGDVPPGAARPETRVSVPPAPPLPTPVPAQSTAKGDYSPARPLGLRVSRIVNDPGHGGHDPGAQANGLTDAELVLDVALRLETLRLDHPGIEVVLTRRTNEFVPLEERTAIANRAGPADLFLSIHANSHRQPTLRGIETYVLNFASNPEAEAVAARENATSVQTMGTLPAIVKAITLNNKLAESRELARVVQAALVKQSRSHSTAIKDLGVKQAPFVVLIGAQMPSVLTELAFLTNRSDASLLKQSSYRQQMAVALFDGLVRYQDSLKQVSTVADGGSRR
jgi:N-acetylmuramoyl-L-alanine amidase